MSHLESDFFIGIDLGGKEKKTTSICILEKREGGLFVQEIFCKKCENIFGKDVLTKIRPYLKGAKVIAVDAPLTLGAGKGEMRLFEKFLSQKIFREEGVNPLPPALMAKFCSFARELARKLENQGFALDINLIEVFPAFVKKIIREENWQKTVRCQRRESENQKSSLICAVLAYLHYTFETRYLGYRDGFLFLPEMSFWKKEWQDKFYQAWQEKPYLNYRRLITNLFSK